MRAWKLSAGSSPLKMVLSNVYLPPLSSSHLREVSWELDPVLTRTRGTEGSLLQRVTRFVKLRKNWLGLVTSPHLSAFVTFRRVSKV